MIMELTLTIKGSASVLAMVLASLPDGASAGFTPQMPNAPPVPMMPMPGAGGDGDDDGGPVNVNAPAIDSGGLPWDERIHASTKTVKADGTWTGKRGGPKGEELAAIEAQLRASVVQPVPMQMPAPMPVMQPVPMPIAQPMQPQPMPVMAAPVAMMPQPMPAPIPMMPAPEPIMQQPDPATVATVAQATGTLDFAQFMQHLSGQMSKRDGAGAPLVHADYLAGITKEISDAFAPHGFGPLSAITDIANNPQMITYAAQLMQRDGRWG